MAIARVPWYPWRMEEVEFKALSADAFAKVRAGDLDGAERDLVAILRRVRGFPEHEIRTLQNLTAVFGRAGRMLESLVLGTWMVDLARATGDEPGEAKGLAATCIGRYGLFVGADIAADLDRLEALLNEHVDVRENPGLHMEHRYASFGHALERGDLEAARTRLEEFRALTDPARDDGKLAACVYLGSRAHLAMHEGRPQEALRFLDELEQEDVAEAHHGPELSVLRVEAHAAAGDLVAARAQADAAIAVLASAPDAALSDVIHYGGQLADVLATTLDDMEAARRVYDIVATATFHRIRQVDACAEHLPELGLRGTRDADLVRYRKAFVLRQHELTKRVGALLRGSDARTLRELLDLAEDREFIPICAWCESVRTEDGRWIGIGHLVPRAEPFAITHALCPSCRTTAFAELPGGGEVA